jgi:hypothetical protein
LDDLAFQLSVLKRSKVPVSKCLVIHRNNEYVRVGDLDIEQLFKIEDVTDKVVEPLPAVEAKMETALSTSRDRPNRRRAASESIEGVAINARPFNIQARTCRVLGA